MNYEAAYRHLTDRARGRALTGYSERHHILPKCVGGVRGPVVRLTPEEHYVAHQLLVKMHPENPKLLWAAVNMTGATKHMTGRKNKLYGWLRRRLSEALSRQMTGRTPSPEAREKMRLAKLGKKRGPHSDETKAKTSASMRGKPKSEAHKAALSAAHKGMKYKKPRSAASRRRSSIAIKKAMQFVDRSYMYTSEYRRKQSESTKRSWDRRKAGNLPTHQTTAPAED